MAQIDLDRLRAVCMQGLQFQQQGRWAEAAQAFKTAVDLDPTRAALYVNLGAALINDGKPQEAVAVLRAGIQLDGGIVELHDNLCVALWRMGKFDEAIEAGNSAVSIAPSNANVHLSLGDVYRSVGDLEMTKREYLEALRLDPGLSDAAEGLAFIANFDPNLNGQGVLDACRPWTDRLETPWLSRQLPHRNIPDPDRRLKIGYVAPHFHMHPTAHFALPLMENHNHRHFEIHIFSSGHKDDAMSERFRRCADRWLDIQPLSDEQTAELIRREAIDILIDLAMYLTDNRLRIFCMKPAPIQMTWVAYPGTTGLASIDYRVSDAVIDPPGAPEFCSEKVIRLPHFWMCYDPLSDAPPRMSGQRESILFGSFSALLKLNPRAIRLWARILKAVPNSRIMLLSSSAWQVRKVFAAFNEEGIGQERITIGPTRSRDEYLRLYDQIDIALDTIPYNGVTTACDALWMGVPLAAFVGSRIAERSSASILFTAGLPELVARDEDHLVEVVAALASDRPRLAKYHAELREKVSRSPLMDAKRFAGDMESAYRQAWRQWCAGR